jgi:hypothetical protein
MDEFFPWTKENFSYMRRPLSVIAQVLVIAGFGFSQNPVPSEQETIRLLVHQVQELQEKVNALEARRPLPAESTQESRLEPPPADTASGSSPASDLALHDVQGIQWRGFAEVNYKVLNQRRPELGVLGFVPGSAGNFYAGDFDLFVTSRISDKSSLLAELVFSEGDAQSFSIELDRLQFKYDYNDHFKISLGRNHTGIGYYNTAFHSGKWLQTTADRPLIMEFADDGGLLPTQALGVSITGLVPSEQMGLHYLFEYGSSDTIRPELDRPGVLEDENNGNHINVGLFSRPSQLPGLQIGASFYHDKISGFELGQGIRLGQSIVNGHVVYMGHGVEFLNEGFLIRHTREDNHVTFNMPAFYSQFSKKFGAVRPFVRYQYINANAHSIFDDVGLRHGPSFGIRYDLNGNVALKAQLDHTMRRALPDLNGLQMQLAVAF